MELTFERGDQYRPKGHALVYFRVNNEPDTVYVTYIIALPVKADLTKYVPPFLATHLGSMPLNDFSAFAMPPVPEAVDSYEQVERLARLRDDDMAYADSMFSFDLPRMMEAVTEAVQVYSDLCDQYFNRESGNTVDSGETIGELPGSDTDDESSYQVNEVLFGLMSEADKLTELSRLLGKLRFAQDGEDANMLEEVSDEIKSLYKFLPDQFKLSRLLAAAQDTSRNGEKLAQLYLDRCFRLSSGDFGKVEAIDNEISSIELI